MVHSYGTPSRPEDAGTAELLGRSGLRDRYGLSLNFDLEVCKWSVQFAKSSGSSRSALAPGARELAMQPNRNPRLGSARPASPSHSSTVTGLIIDSRPALLAVLAVVCTGFCEANASTTVAFKAAVIDFAVPSGATFDSVRQSVSWLTDLVVAPIYLLARMWDAIRGNSSIAIIASAVSAAVFAYYNIRQQIALARLKETFGMLNRDNWDQDVIQARNQFGKIKSGLAGQAKSISHYCYTSARPPIDGAEADQVKHIADCTTLLTILNDYENIALGVRRNILDEVFLHRWMRGTLLDDWETLSPLVSEYRQRKSRPEAYIEFEGLAGAWKRGLSYRPRRWPMSKSNRLNRPDRKVSIN